MASKNKLVGFITPETKVEDEIIPMPGVMPCWMYHEDTRKGKLFQTRKELEEAIKDGWVDTPAKLSKISE
jgi:hypothetical protein